VSIGEARADLDDRTLLRLHVNGDPDAFRELTGRHRHRLWSVAYRTLGEPHEAEDAVQDALIKAHRSAPSFRGESSVSTWLHRIVVNASLDRVRRRRIHLLDDPETADRETARDDFAPLHARMDVERALATLPEEQRLPIVLTDIEGMSLSDAAELLGIPLGTLKSRNSRGKAAMRKFLVGEGNLGGSRRVGDSSQGTPEETT
jgi:RNA polymerase sigma-70 factor (ECF subfamily)